MLSPLERSCIQRDNNLLRSDPFGRDQREGDLFGRATDAERRESIWERQAVSTHKRLELRVFGIRDRLYRGECIVNIRAVYGIEPMANQAFQVLACRNNEDAIVEPFECHR